MRPMSPNSELKRSDRATNQNRTRSALRRRSTGSGWAEGLTTGPPSRGPAAGQGGAPRIARPAGQLLLDAQELVVLGGALPARGRARLDLSEVQGHGEIGDEGVFGLAGTVRQDRRVAGRAGQGDGAQRLGQSPDLIRLDQNGVGDPFLDSFPQDGRVGDEQVVADEL